MIKKYYKLFYIFLFADIIFSQTASITFNSEIDGRLVEFTSSNLPIVVINTNGQPIPNDDKITANMGIIYNGEGVRNNLSDPFNNYDGKIGIEIRGSSSQQFPKKQYAFETRDTLGNDLDVSLLGFPQESDWILFAPYNDKSLMRDVLAYKLASDMGRYASRSKFCEVVLNNEYVGVYVLLEKVKRDNNRVDIKKLEPTDITGDALTGGYIIKIDKWDGENNDGWSSSYLPFPQTQFPVYYQYHYPKPDEIVLQQKDYIQNKIFQFETVMNFSVNISDSLTGYPKFIDVSSFVDFFLVNEITKNVDGYRLSSYLYKDRDSRNTKIYAGPVWDFNLGFGNADYYQGWMTDGWQLEYLSVYENYFQGEPYLMANWWKKLFDDQLFRNKVFSRWQEAKTTILNNQHILEYIDSITVLLDESKTRNFQKWPVLGVWVWPNYFVGQNYWQEILYLKSWIQNRINWIDANIIGEPTLIEELDVFPKEFHLYQNYPNPFNPSTTIEFAIPEDGFVELVIYDVLGSEIKKILSDYFSKGQYKINFDAGNLVSGVYLYRIKFKDMIDSKSMLLLK